MTLSTTFNTANVNATHNSAALVGLATAAGAAAPNGPEGYIPLSPESILIFCQKQLQELDTKIASRMKDQRTLVGLQDMLGGINSLMKNTKAGADDSCAFNSHEAKIAIEQKINAAIEAAKSAGQPDVVATLEQTLVTLNDKGDDAVGKSELKDMCDSIDQAATSLRSSAELSMLDMQSFVSKRATMLQLTTGMMNSMNEGAKSIAGNVGR